MLLPQGCAKLVALALAFSASPMTRASGGLLIGGGLRLALARAK